MSKKGEGDITNPLLLDQDDDQDDEQGEAQEEEDDNDDDAVGEDEGNSVEASSDGARSKESKESKGAKKKKTKKKSSKKSSKQGATGSSAKKTSKVHPSNSRSADELRTPLVEAEDTASTATSGPADVRAQQAAAKLQAMTAISSEDYHRIMNGEDPADPLVEAGYHAQTQTVPQHESGVRSSTICGYLWVVTLVLIVCGFIPWAAIEMHQSGAETHVIAWFVAGIFVCLAIPMTLWDVAMHLRHWNNPKLQRHIVRILFMVPIYAIDSWFALRFPSINIYFDVARETYEAYVIYNFYVYLLSFLRQRPDFDIDIHKRKNQPHMFPMCCLKEWRMGQPFLNACTNGVTSYVVIRLLCTCIAFASELAGKYGDSDIAFDKAWIYIVFMNSFSQLWAMYCLVLFYHAFTDDLKAIKPFQKFITIKAVIFLSFWQSVLIAVLVETNVIKSNENWSYYTQDSVAAGIQDFIICIEMFIAAIAHRSVFSYKEHLTDDPSHRQKMSFRRAVTQLLDVRDVAYTVMDHVQTIYTLDGRIMEKRAVDTRGEHTALLSNNFSHRNGSLLMPSQADDQDTHSSTSTSNNEHIGVTQPASSSLDAGKHKSSYGSMAQPNQSDV